MMVFDYWSRTRRLKVLEEDLSRLSRAYYRTRDGLDSLPYLSAFCVASSFMTLYFLFLSGYGLLENFLAGVLSVLIGLTFGNHYKRNLLRVKEEMLNEGERIMQEIASLRRIR